MSLERIAVEQLETERMLSLRKVRKALTGTWRSEEPMKRGDGKFQEVSRTYLLYAVSLPESDENKGAAQVRISVENDPKEAIEVTAQFFVYAPDEVVLVESDKKKLGSWTSGDRWSLKFVNDQLHASAVGSSDKTHFILERVPRLDTPNKRQETFFQLRAALNGTWISANVLDRNDKSVQIKGSSVAYRFEFPDESQLSGGLRVVAFLVDSPADSVSVAANLKIINDTDFSVTETERKQLSPNWRTGDTWTVRVKNGVLHAKCQDGSSMELRKRSN